MTEALNRVLDLIEARLERGIAIEDLTGAAYMSTPVLYRVFTLCVGMPVFAYIRRRRLSEAAMELLAGDGRILDVAMKYSYESHEAFSRAVRQQFGVPPSRLSPDLVRKKMQRRIHMTHPDGKGANRGVSIVSLAAFSAASCHIVGDKPELRSCAALGQWAKLCGLSSRPGWARYFGFDNPENGTPEAEAKGHGYEQWLVLPEGWTDKDVGDDSLIGFVRFPGGLFATSETTVAKVGSAWKDLCGWTARNGYGITEDRCLEETIAGGDDEMLIRLRLYLPVKRKEGCDNVPATEVREDGSEKRGAAGSPPLPRGISLFSLQ